jgi:hypothetical protein
VNIKVAPINHTAQTTTAVEPREIVFARSPIMDMGAAHERWDVQTLSTAAPSGKMKLSDVATQIQYFVVALPRGIDVRTQAANQTSEAYRR